MQQEDDLRGLAKVMEFMRAISILLVIIHIYWYCYPSVQEWNINISVIDKILLNFNRTTGLFSTILWTKLLSLVFECAIKRLPVNFQMKLFFEPRMSNFFDFMGFPDEGVSFGFVGAARRWIADSIVPF